MKTARFALLFAALLCSELCAQTPAQRSSLPLREPSPAQLLADLRHGGYILYFRHAATDFSQNDEKMKSYEDCAEQRNLVDQGRADARAAGAAIRQLGIPVERVLASPFCRTVETAQLLFGRVEKMTEVRGGPAVEKDSGYSGSRQRQSRGGKSRQPVLQRRRSALSRRGRSRGNPAARGGLPGRRQS